MRLKVLVLAAVIAALAMVPVQLAGCADADEADAYYCYTHDMSFYYDGGTPDLDEVRWEAVGIVDGVETQLTVIDNGEENWIVYLDREEVSQCSQVRVTQTAVRDGVTDVEVRTYTPVAHLEDGEVVIVSFVDTTGDIIAQRYITNTTVVPAGSDFVSMPEDPVRDGDTFLGWYTADGVSFNPALPIAESVTVYARWSGSADPSLPVGSHLVTFDVGTGLEYSVVSSGNGSVTFEVGVSEGYELIGEISVTSNGGTLSTADGVTHTLSGIDRDIVVTISGETNAIVPVGPSGPVAGPAQTESGMGTMVWVLLLVLIVLCAVLAYAYMRARQSRQAD